MLMLRHSLAVLVCLVCVPHITVAFLRRSGLRKRLIPLPGTGSQDESESLGDKLFFKGAGFPRVTVGIKHSSIELACEVGGRPTPTIHWLKNGVRITQGTYHTSHDDEAAYEDRNKVGGLRVLRLSTTRSRLYLDCLSEEHEAEYSCVAESPTIRKTQSTTLTVERPDNVLYSEVHRCSGKRSNKGEPARIYMWTSSRLEYENAKIQLFCRAEGSPQPSITWYDRDNMPIEDGDHYRIAKNGDLIIRDVSWSDNMGMYSCVATNEFGADSQEAFLYPMPREDDFGFPL